jgi:DNA-binding MurR/RpiR family transcriptional regulator
VGRNVTKEDVEKLIAERYRSLPPKLKVAARHVLDAPRDIAIQSMRSVAADAALQPATMLRLARELGFRSYAAFRELYVNWLSSSEMTFVARAKSLRKRRVGDGQETLFAEMYATEVVSLDRTLGGANAAAFASAKKLLLAARRFYVLGLRSLFPAAYYLDYACRLFSDKSVLVTGVGGGTADELRRATAKDALVAFSFEPYARLTVEAVQYAAERNVRIVAVTDSIVSPIAESASVVLLAPNAGPALIPSILPAMAAAQALASLMVTAGGADTLDEIARSDAQLRSLHAYIGR